MTVDTARNVPRGSILHADVCVIGSGAAGITIAHELDGTALDVLVIEAGGMKRDLAAEREVFHIEHLGMPALNPEAPRARFYGGSTNLWFGRVATLDRIDFEARSWVEHSGWPITYDEMWPWIVRAAAILDVPQFDKIDLAAWGPNPTLETFNGARGAELGVFLWSNAQLMAEHHREQIERSRNVKVLVDSTVTALVSNAAGTAIDEVEVTGPGAEPFVVRATTVVLAAGGLENPRLLLASTARAPAGIGNQNDLVGRFYMEHPRGEGLAEADISGLPTQVGERLNFLGERTSSEHGTVQLRVKFSEQLQRDEQLLNHAMHAHLVSAEQASSGFQSAKRLVQRLRVAGSAERSPISADVRNVARDAPALLALAAKKLTRRIRPTRIVFIDQMEQEPDPASRITVDHTRRDRYGLPQILVDWRIGDSTYRSQRRMHELVGQVLRDVGIGSFASRLLDEPAVVPELWDMKHPAGTTRMATAPDRGVVDTDGRVYGVANLYVAGSSVFPTVGHANPTLTIVALAARVADLLAGRAPEARRVLAVTEPARSARLGVGCARLGEATGGVSWRQSVRILREAADGGVTYFDTADAYTSGASERLIGEAFRRRRDDVTIATKAGYLFRERSLAEMRARFIAGPMLRRMGRGVVESATSDDGKFAAQDFRPAALRDALEASLRRLRTEHVDVFQLHAPRGVDIEGVMELVADLTAAGKIRRFGIGVEELTEAAPWLDVPGLHSVELPFSILDRSAAPIIAIARERGVSVVARSVLGGGPIARATTAPGPSATAGQSLLDDLRRCAQRCDMTLVQLAVAFASGHPGIEVVLVGVRIPEHLVGLLGAAASSTPEREVLDQIDAVIALHPTPGDPQVG